MALTKITTSVVAVNSLTVANIADNAIDATKIASNSILTRHIDDAQITTDQILDGTIATADIADDAVTAAKLANSINTDIATGPAALPKAGGTMTGVLNMGSQNITDIAKVGINNAPLSGSQVYIKKLDSSTNLQRWGEGTDSNSQDSYRFRIDQNYKFIANSGSGDTFVVESSSGKVGIGGATNLDNQLEVLGNIRVRNAPSNNPQIKMNNGDVEMIALELESGASGVLGLRGNSLNIDSNGKVIIGDTQSSAADDLLQIETPASGGGHGIHIRRNDSNGDQGIGRIMFGNNNDIDLATISSVTDGQADCARLVFSTQPTSGNSTESMRISSTGLVTKPRISAANGAFWARGTNNPTATGNTNVGVVYTTLEQGGGYSTSTGRYTAPVAGWYSFSTNVRIDGYSGGGYMRIAFFTGTTPTPTQSGYGQGHAIYGPDSLDDQYYSMTTSWTVYLGSGNQVGVCVQSSIGNYTIHQESNFSGFLVG